jgi:small-conductance mechanosensitive channel
MVVIPAELIPQIDISKGGTRAWLFVFGVVGVLAAATLLLSLLKRLVRGRLEEFARRTATPIDDLFIALVEKTRFVFLLFLALWIIPSVVRLPSGAQGLMRVTAVMALLVQFAIWANTIISLLVERFLEQRGSSHATAATAASALAFLARLLVGAIILLIGLNNLGVNVTAMVAGLGIGGLVVALALQNLLRDLLGALAIVIGRPFLVGDVIETDNVIGTVEFVGMRWTQIRSASGEEITVPNNKLLESTLRNLSRRREFRVVMDLRLSYDTPPDALAALPESIRAIVLAAGPTRFDNAHVKRLGPLAVELEVVYFVNTADYSEQVKVRNAVNLAVLGMLNRQGIEMARPSGIIAGP